MKKFAFIISCLALVAVAAFALGAAFAPLEAWADISAAATAGGSTHQEIALIKADIAAIKFWGGIIVAVVVALHAISMTALLGMSKDVGKISAAIEKPAQNKNE